MTTGTARMPIDPRLLIITQWLSPAYPVGSFAFSHGIEDAVDAGQITDAPALERWLADLLKQGSGWADAVWIAEAARGARPVAEVDALARAFAASAERLREAQRQGAAFRQITQDVWHTELTAQMLPVVFGEAAAELRLDTSAVIALYLQSFVSNLVAAAQRLMPLGQTDAQGIVARLSPLCGDIAARAMDADSDDIFANCFASDIAAMCHETMEPRIFQT
ncbi:urease accessory protein UreF [Sagittula sp. SSi028]|uniref:urease accessory protein UreF n=1 Tax=Sagittula sp. SSi028 TaxID=3400636 RepID=UPI003AF449C1